MLIKYLDRRYEVVQKLKTTEVLDLYVAKDVSDVKQTAYTLACIRDSELARKLILVTTKKNTSLSFKDLHESFNMEGRYYIVFRYTEGKTLKEGLEENIYNLKERLLLFKNLLGQIILLNMPECFIYEVLREDNIIVDEAMGVRFHYSFTEVDYYWQVEEKYCLRRVLGLTQRLFLKELTDKSLPKLEEFMKNLALGRYKDIWDCYEAFNDLYERLEEKSEYEDIMPGRIWWRAWEAFKRKAPVLKSVLAVLLMLAAGAYLLLNLPDPVLSEDGIVFEQIGTLDVKEQAE